MKILGFNYAIQALLRLVNLFPKAETKWLAILFEMATEARIFCETVYTVDREGGSQMAER